MAEPGNNSSDRQPAGDNPAAPPPAPEFRPDPAAAARLARLRVVLLIATAVLLAAAFVLVLGYRPPGMRRPARARFAAETPPPPAAPAESSRPTVPAAPAVSAPAQAADVAHATVASLDSLVGRARDLWLRAGDQMPPEETVRERTGDAVVMLRRAGVLADSARAVLALGDGPTAMLAAEVHEASGVRAYHLSALYSAERDYLQALRDDAGDRRLYYQAWQDAAEALGAGDTAEAETKQNVADSYLRRSEARQPALERMSGSLREALQGLDATPK